MACVGEGEEPVDEPLDDEISVVDDAALSDEEELDLDSESLEDLREQEDILGELADDPFEWLGQTVTVAGDVNVVVTEQVFTIANETMLDDDEMPVVLPEDGADVVEEGDSVLVTGEVTQFVIEDVGEVYEELGEEFVEEWDGKPVILATEVEVLE